jgi:sugar diacid utilization regulator
MNIKISDILQLPSFQGSKVIAGKQGINRRISAISVSEYTWGDQFKDVDFNYYDSEIIISAFYAIKDNVDTQCQNIREYNANKVAGLILFYVGVVLPYVDERLIQLADNLGFPIIVMPEGRPDLRYSETIYEVIEAILKKRMTSYNFKNDVIDQVCRLPDYHQSVSSVLRILSDKTHSTIILADSSNKPINASIWPRNLTVESYLENEVVSDRQGSIQLNNGIYNVYRCFVKSSHQLPLRVMVYKRDMELDVDIVRQIGETIQMSINLWDKKNGENLLTSLVKAILKDELYAVRQIANAFNISVKDIKDMWIINTNHNGELKQLLNKSRYFFSNELSHLSNAVILDTFDGDLVAFWIGEQNPNDLQHYAETLISYLSADFIDVSLSTCHNLEDFSHIRNAFFANRRTLKTAQEIYPSKNLFSYSDIRFADKCKKIIESGEDNVIQHLEILRFIPKDKGISLKDMLDTLSCYFLDTQCNAELAGHHLYLHKNTIQYRVKKLKARVPGGLNNIPEIDEFYTALALKRILDQSPSHNKKSQK